MQNRIFLVHRWWGEPNGDWYPWLKSVLVGHGFDVSIPAMPETNTPHISRWVSRLSEIVGDADENTYFIGHSIGCQTILRYLETLDEGTRVGGAIFVAGWFHLTDKSYDTDEDRQIGKEWITAPINFRKVRKHLDRSVAIFSEDDPYVPVSDSKIFKEELNSRIIIHPNRGHFTKDDGAFELHVVLNEIEKMAKA